MDANEFLRLKTLFNALADLPPDERDARLDAPGLGDTLRQRLRSLFEADVAMQTMTVRSALAVAADIAHDASRWTGRRIGAFEVERELGHGGMGSVLLAHRADGSVTQKVAIKVIRQERLDAHTLARFRLERQVLAVLQHPNIAALLDLGELDDGTPYVVMEYIDGLPITQFAQQRQLGLKQRLQLFLEVCEAVSYAHRNMIVHRDLKPSNVLVNTDGDPKLLDFGIAKALLGQLGSIDVEQTADAQRFFSPSNAAPEQLRGDAITTACDVYGLGVLLYELLSNATPFALEGRTPAQIERDICDVDPLPPSARTRAGAESYRIPRDLDLITLRCLRKAPGDRYASVDRLAEDLRNFLDDRPVAARRGNVLYRTSRFLARNKIAVGLSAAVLAAVVTGGVTVWRQQLATLEQRTRADNMTDLILSALRSIDPKQSINKDIPAKDVFDRVAVHTLANKDLDSASRARLLNTIANVDVSLGVPDQAAALLDKIDTAPMSAEERNEFMLTRARTKLTLGQFDDARQLATDGRKAAVAPADSARWEMVLAQIDFEQGKVKESVERLQPLSVAPIDVALKDEVRLLLGNALRILSRNEESRATYLALLSDQRQRLPANHPVLFNTLCSLFTLEERAGELDKAAAYAAEAETIAIQSYGKQSLPFLRSLGNRAKLAHAHMDYAEAIRLTDEQLAILKPMVGEYHPRIAKEYFNLGADYDRAHKPEQSDEYYRKAIDVGERVWLPSDLNVLLFRVAFACKLVVREKFIEAQEVIRPALHNAAPYPDLVSADIYVAGLAIDAIGDYARDRSEVRRKAVVAALEQAHAKAEGRAIKYALGEIDEVMRKVGALPPAKAAVETK